MNIECDQRFVCWSRSFLIKNATKSYSTRVFAYYNERISLLIAIIFNSKEVIFSFSLTFFLSSLIISFLFHYVIYVVLSHYVIYFVLSHYVFYFVSNVSDFLMTTTFNRIKFRWLVSSTSSDKLFLIIIHLMFDLNLSKRLEQKQREENNQSETSSHY